MGKRPKSTSFTRVPHGINPICDKMNDANDDYDNWVPVSNAQKRLKEAIDRIESRIKKE